MAEGSRDGPLRSPKVPCENCDAKFDNSDALARHRRVHNKIIRPCFFKGCRLEVYSNERHLLSNHLRSDHKSCYDQDKNDCWRLACKHKTDNTKVLPESFKTVPNVDTFAAGTAPGQNSNSAKVPCDICKEPATEEELLRHRATHYDSSLKPCFFKGCQLEFHHQKRFDFLSHIQSAHDAYHDQTPDKDFWATVEWHMKKGTKVLPGSSEVVQDPASGAALWKSSANYHVAPAEGQLEAFGLPLPPKEISICAIQKEYDILVHIANCMTLLETRERELGISIKPLDFAKPCAVAEPFPDDLLNKSEEDLNLLSMAIQCQRMVFDDDFFTLQIEDAIMKVHKREEELGLPFTDFDLTWFLNEGH